MAATVTGTFVIIDKATGPLRRMRREAEKTDRALQSLGDRLDRVGSNKTVRSLEQTERSVRNVGRAAQSSSRDSDHFSSAMRRTESRARSLRGHLGELGAALTGVTKLLKPATWIGMGVAIGVAIQAVSALSAGVVALGPRLADLAGVAGALPAVFTSMGLALGTAKFAFQNLGQAMHGNKKALQSLTPEARQFLDTLKSYRPEIQKLRSAAQRGLFPGLDDALQQLKVALPTVRGLLAGMGAQLGRQARLTARSFTDPTSLRQINQLGQQGIQLFGRFGTALRSLGHAFLNIGVAARPLTNWLSKTIVGWAHTFERMTADQGRMRLFFERTRRSLSTFFDIIKNLWGFFRGLGRAARPLGEDLYNSLDRAARRWNQWANSAKGQNWLRDWFAQSKPAIHAIARLIAALGKAIATFDQHGLTQTANTLTHAVPTVQRLFEQLAHLGPTVSRFLEAILRTATDLIGPAGPITMLLDAVTNILNVIDDLMERVPVFGRLLSAAITIYGLSKLLDLLRKAAESVGNLARSWMGVSRAADVAAASEARASSIPAGVPGERPGTPGAPGGPGVVPVGPVGNPRRFGGPRNIISNIRAGRGLPTAAIPGSIGRGFGMAGAALAGAARFLAPLAAFGAVLGALRGTGGKGVSGLIQNTFSGATGGLIPGVEPYDPSARQGHGYHGLVDTIAGRRVTSLALDTRQTPLTPQFDYQTHGVPLGRVYRDPKNEAQAHQSVVTLLSRQRSLTEQISSKSKEVRDYAKGELAATQELVPKYQQINEQLRLQRVTEQRQFATGRTERYQKAFQFLTAHGVSPEKALSQQVRNMQRDLAKLGPSGSKILGENTLKWVDQMAKANPAFRKQADRIRRSIVDRFHRLGIDVQIVNDQIFTGTRNEWRNIAQKMQDPMEIAKERLSDDFTTIQRYAVASLTAMGYKPNEAKALVLGQDPSANANTRKYSRKAADVGPGGVISPRQGAPTGRQYAQGVNTKAHGGIVPGWGSQDKVAVPGATVAPGEAWIANRHTLQEMSRATLAVYGKTAQQMIQGETRPHGESPRLARGGGFKLGTALGNNAVATAHPELHAGIATAVQAVLNKFPGLSISSTTGGHHANGSYHYRGEAADISGAQGVMDSAGAWIQSAMGSGLTEGIHNPTLSVKNGSRVSPGFWGSGTWAQHVNHIHLAVAGAFAAGAAAGGAVGGLGAPLQISPLKSPKTRLRGVPGALEQRASDVYAKALTNKVNERLGAAGTVGPTGPLGKGRLTRDQVIQLWIAAGGPPGVAETMANIAWAESGWLPRNVNPNGGAAGLWQILGLPFPGNPLDPMTNARMAVAKYRAAGLSPWAASRAQWARRAAAPGAALGRRIGGDGGSIADFAGWFGNGLDAVFDQPTLLGVGDRGEERVRIEPSGRAGAGGSQRPVQVSIGKIENHRPGDIRRMVREEVGAGLRDVERALTDSPLEEDDL